MLTGGKFMPELNLRQPGFTYSVCGLFTKHREKIKKLKETGDLNYVFKKQLNKACFVMMLPMLTGKI